MNWSYIEVQRARSKPNLSEVPYPSSETNCTSCASREISMDKDVIIFTDVLLHKVTGHGKTAVPTYMACCSSSSARATVCRARSAPTTALCVTGWDPEATLWMDAGIGAPG